MPITKPKYCLCPKPGFAKNTSELISIYVFPHLNPSKAGNLNLLSLNRICFKQKFTSAKNVLVNVSLQKSTLNLESIYGTSEFLPILKYCIGDTFVTGLIK